MLVSAGQTWYLQMSSLFYLSLLGIFNCVKSIAQYGARAVFGVMIAWGDYVTSLVVIKV